MRLRRSTIVITTVVTPLALLFFATKRPSNRYIAQISTCGNIAASNVREIYNTLSEHDCRLSNNQQELIDISTGVSRVSAPTCSEDSSCSYRIGNEYISSYPDGTSNHILLYHHPSSLHYNSKGEKCRTIVFLGNGDRLIIDVKIDAYSEWFYGTVHTLESLELCRK